MPAVSATIQNVAVNQTTGTIRFDFTNGTQREFADFEALQTLANSYDSDVTRAEDLAIVSAVRRSPDGSNLDVCNGVTCTVDGAANVPVSYSGLPD